MITAEVWFDIACPWCYVGMRTWTEAVAASKRPVRTRWRSFQLRPDAARHRTRSLTEIMRTDWGMHDEEVEQVFTRIRTAGAEHRLVLRTESVYPASTLDAHRLVHHAATHDRVPDLLERLFHAYHSELRDITDHDVLTQIATDAGLAEPELTRLLAGDRHTDAVLAAHADAHAAGITAVPGYRVNGRTLSGAFPVEHLLALLTS